jgi:hypothetical protein
MANKKRPGRPAKSDSERRKPAFVLQLTDAEHDLIKQVAEPRVGTWAREVLLKAAKRKAKLD